MVPSHNRRDEGPAGCRTAAAHRFEVVLGVDDREDDSGSKARAFLGLFLKAERRIFAYILTLLPHRADAEDVLQEASAVMWGKFDENHPPDDFVAWGCRIAYFRVRLHLRGKRRQRVLFSGAMLERLAETMAEEAEALELSERLEVINGCFQKLGRRDRELIAERLKAGATVQSTAEALGRSVDTVYKSMSRIRKAIFDCVSRALESEGPP
jgi:RNA polymerase sigma-70 factor (ECF subfamily)